MANESQKRWQLGEVRSPHIEGPVQVVIGKDIPYVANANRLQNLNIYLLKTPETEALVGRPVNSLPAVDTSSSIPTRYVHIHGGAWRAPELTSTSIEATVAHAFSSANSASAGASAHPITTIISLNYTISQYPTHATDPYDAAKAQHSDPAREAVHPMHIRDVLHGFALLRNMGLGDGSYVLSGHSCGSCIAFQATLQAPAHWGLAHLAGPPRPAAQLGFNGLYDLPDLVHGLGAPHAWLAAEYRMLQGYAFGADESVWPAASPARFDPKTVQERVKKGLAPNVIVLDQSTEDQLVPMNQTEKMERNLGLVGGLKLLRGHECTGTHAAPWEQGYMIWNSVKNVLAELQK